MKTYDLIIVGAGPAGMTAGIYAARNGLKTAIISKDIGGTANSILMLENWPGFKGSGSELMKKFYEQLKGYEIDILMNDIEDVEKTREGFKIKTRGEDFLAKGLIIASGTERKKLNIPREKELTGRGVSYCITCDSFFFKGKIVAVVGGSDCAAISALALSDIAKKVYIFYRGEELRCEDINSDRLKKKENVEIHYNSIPKEIKGEDKVESFVISHKGKEREYKVDGIFVEIGGKATTEFLKKLDLKMNEEKCIVVDENMKTSVPGVFAAGDVTCTKLNQVVVASAEGAIAAKNAYNYISKKD